MKVYTKAGDDGSTGLANGERLKKSSARIEAYGQIDELSSWIGAVLAFMPNSEYTEVLVEIQNDLHKIMAELARAQKKFEPITPKDIQVIESLIDGYSEEIPPLSAFILPGGSKAGSILHLCRTSCRSAERELVRLSEIEFVNPIIVQYLNRLGDLLFILARKVNYDAKQPERNPDY